MNRNEQKIATIGGTFDPDLLIRHALERGMVEEAAEAIEAFIAADPEHHEGWFLKGVHGLLVGDCTHASLWFDEALLRGADRRAARLGRAQALLGAQRAKHAWLTLTELVADEPGDHEVIHWLLRAGSALQKWADLSSILEEHLEMCPEDDAARFAYAGVSFRLGNLSEARTHHDILRERNADLMGLDDLTRLLEPETLAASAA